MLAAGKAWRAHVPWRTCKSLTTAVHTKNTEKPDSMAVRTFLKLQESERQTAVALGALQDQQTGSLFVPAGVSLVPFHAWLPASPALTASTAVTVAAPAGISLTMLMARCTAAMQAAFPEPVWVRIEISQIKSSGGNLYLQAVERTKDDGREIAKATAQIWRANVAKIGRKFSEATAMELAAGIQILVLVKPQISPQYGLGLQIIDIDPTFTLGDLEAKRKRIRDEIAQRGFGDANRRLPAPDDFFRVAVVSPEGAAGLEDFQAVADLLAHAHLCEFTYFHATFQGERAKESVKQAMVAAHQQQEDVPFDALAIIRGGGAAADLHWLDEFVLAAMVCRFRCPVLTGIGHERDQSLLDEYANKVFGTPSKVIAYIKETIGKKAAFGYENWVYVAQSAAARLGTAEAKSRLHLQAISAAVEKKLDGGYFAADTRLHEGTTAAAARLQRADGQADLLNRAIISNAQSAVDLAEQTIAHGMVSVSERALATLASAGTRVDNDFSSVTLAARRSIDGIDEHLEEQRQNIRATTAQRVATADAAVVSQMRDVTHFSRKMLWDAAANSRDLMSGILAHGVEPTLRRGFALVRNAQGPVCTRAAAQASAELEIVFRDGMLKTEGKRDG